MPVSVPQLATYLSFAFIFTAYAIKVAKVLRMPAHLRWELYPIPHEKGYKYGGSYFEELEWWNRPQHKNRARALLFKLGDYLSMGGYYKRSRTYWLGLLPWHIGFYLLMAFQAFALVGALVAVWLGNVSLPLIIILYAMMAMGWIGFGLGLIGSAIMLIQKLISSDFRLYTTKMDYFNYTIFLVLFACGYYLLTSDPGLSGYLTFWQGVVTFRYVQPEPAAYLFIILFSLHLVHLPFTRSTHYITKLISFFGILWDDTPNSGGKMEDRVKEYLDYPVSWSAPHIQSGKTWAEAASSLPETKPK